MPQDTYLVPKLCLGTHLPEALLRDRQQVLKRSVRTREAELPERVFPSGAWERAVVG